MYKRQIPSDWKDVSFDKLRAIGAFVVSASLENGDVSLVKVVSEKGGLLRLVNPFKGKFRIAGKKKKITEKNGVLELKTRAGEEIKMCIRDRIKTAQDLYKKK